MDRILLYHTGFEEIRSPDVHYGRKNADFGQGFYMSPDRSFSERWAKERKGSSTVINTYELLTDGLRIKRLDRDEEWFDCIFSNRNGKSDLLSGYDVIIGPIDSDQRIPEPGAVPAASPGRTGVHAGRDQNGESGRAAYLALFRSS